MRPKREAFQFFALAIFYDLLIAKQSTSLTALSFFWSHDTSLDLKKTCFYTQRHTPQRARPTEAYKTLLTLPTKGNENIKGKETNMVLYTSHVPNLAYQL